MQGCGTAASKQGKELNVLKNRDDPGSGFQTLGVPAIRKSSNSQQSVVSGLVPGVYV